MSPATLAAGRIAAAVRPGRAADSHADAVAARLRRLAAAGRTGMLPFSGQSDGAIYLNGGRVVFAESARTPGPAGSGTPPIAEPIADATLDLLSGPSGPSRFRSTRIPAAGLADGFSVESLLAEVARRQNVLEQFAGVVRADTTVVRDPRMAAERIQVSALQWALLIRVRDGATARALAWELRRSVFGMTIDVYRLLRLRLLAAVDYPARTGPAALPGSTLSGLALPGSALSGSALSGSALSGSALPESALPGSAVRGVLPVSFTRAVTGRAADAR
jgi:hypothetical protein